MSGTLRIFDTGCLPYRYGTRYGTRYGSRELLHDRFGRTSQAQLAGSLDELVLRGDAELGVDPGQVTLHRALADEEGLADSGGCPALDGQPGHLRLPRGED